MYKLYYTYINRYLCHNTLNPKLFSEFCLTIYCNECKYSYLNKENINIDFNIWYKLNNIIKKDIINV